MNAGGWRQASDVLGEGRGREIDPLGALGKADGPPSSPVHGDGSNWVSAANNLCRLLGVEMALTNGRSPASDGKQRDVDVRHFLQRKLRTRVPRIPTPAGAVDEIAERGSAMTAPRMTAAVVVGGQDAYLQAAKVQLVTRLDLMESQTAGRDWLEQAARACWGEKNCGGWDESKRGQVGVVGVQVREQDDVRVRSLRRRNRPPDSTEMAEARSQDGVEQCRGAAILPRARAVPPP
ncbi:MAG: hypothetical protein JWN06_3336 [Propionibacteriaceae bacterium]|jgi:hypothetical protein|nr:hypothetical protein [Propionibacteriaceae bacterium]